MPRITTSIADEFYTHLEKEGLTKLAYPNLQSYIDDAEARASSQDVEVIEALYNVKPRQDLIHEYESSIMEAAHKEPVVISTSYDRINSLVENNIERQTIIRNILNKVPTGNLTGFKYAKHELTMELVRLANEMDAKNKDAIFKLADACLFDLNEECIEDIKKEAIAPLVIAGIAGVILGATWLLGHTKDSDNGPLANTDRAISALKDLAENSFWESDVDSEVKLVANDLIKDLFDLKESISKFNTIQSFVSRPRDLKDAAGIAKLVSVAKEHGDFVKDEVEKFKSKVDNLLPKIKDAIDNFSSDYYRNTHTKPSEISEMVGSVGKLFHGGNGLFADDYQSAVNALEVLTDSLEMTEKKLSNFDAMAAKYSKAVEKPIQEQETEAMQVSEKEKDNLLEDYHKMEQSVFLPGTKAVGEGKIEQK